MSSRLWEGTPYYNQVIQPLYHNQVIQPLCYNQVISTPSLQSSHSTPILRSSYSTPIPQSSCSTPILQSSYSTPILQSRYQAPKGAIVDSSMLRWRVAWHINTGWAAVMHGGLQNRAVFVQNALATYVSTGMIWYDMVCCNISLQVFHTILPVPDAGQQQV